MWISVSAYSSALSPRISIFVSSSYRPSQAAEKVFVSKQLTSPELKVVLPSLFYEPGQVKNLDLINKVKEFIQCRLAGYGSECECQSSLWTGGNI